MTFEILTKKRKKVQTKVLGRAVVTSGDASLTFKPKKVLSKAITVVYSGDADFKPSALTAQKLSKKGQL